MNSIENDNSKYLKLKKYCEEAQTTFDDHILGSTEKLFQSKFSNDDEREKEFSVKRTNSENGDYLTYQNHEKCQDDRPLSTTALYDFTKSNNHCDFHSYHSSNQSLQSCNNDFSLPFDSSESSGKVSTTDLKLANLRSKLKAETEEIRKWREKTDIKEELQTKSNTEFYLNISSQRINQSNDQQNFTIIDEDQSNSHNKYRAILVNNVPRVSNEDETDTSYSTRVNTSTDNKFSLNQQTVYLQNESRSQENINVNLNSSVKCDFICSQDTLGDFQNEIQNLEKQNELSATKLKKYLEINLKLKSDNEKVSVNNQELKYNYNDNETTDHQNIDISNNELEKYRSDSDTKMILKTFLKHIKKLEQIIKYRDQTLNVLKMQISFEVMDKDKVFKENVSLKKQQIELKNQMIHLLKPTSKSLSQIELESKIIEDSNADQVKIEAITENLKILVEENKSIFKDISTELFIRYEKWFDSIENIKFLQDKLNLRESQYQNLRSQLEILSTNFAQFQKSSRNINNSLTDQNSEIKCENLNLSEEMNIQRNQLDVLIEQNECLKSEYTADKNLRFGLQKTNEKLMVQLKELKNFKSLLEEKVNILTNQLLINSKEMCQKEKCVVELQDRIKLAKNYCDETQNRIDEMKTKQRDYVLKTDTEMKMLEDKHIEEKKVLTDTINELIFEFKKYSKISERTIAEQNKEIINFENQLGELKQQKMEMVEYLYKLPTTSLKWTHFFQ